MFSESGYYGKTFFRDNNFNEQLILLIGRAVLMATSTIKHDKSRSKNGSHFQTTGNSSQMPPKMTYLEVQGDLFSCPISSSMAHCVSEDLAMGKGVATLFKEKFGGIRELKAQGVKSGGVAILERDGRFIYYLVTKHRHFHKPTYQTLKSSLSAMKDHCQRNNVKSVALPRIGCGLDQLSWEKVAEIIREVFRDEDVTIKVYYL